MTVIKSISEYLDYLSTIKIIARTQSSVGSGILFRGQSNVSWSLAPSLYRKGLFYHEKLLLTELRHYCPEDFGDNKFDTLVKMQHYGLPTRLLDTTTNPLVALYFACQSEKEMYSDGAVFVFPNLPIHWSTDPLVSLVMDFVFDYEPSNLYLDGMFEAIKAKYQYEPQRLMPDDIQLLVHYLTIPAFAVMPARTNARVAAQDGAFFIFGMALKERVVSTNPGTLGKVYYTFIPSDVAEPQKIWHTAETVVIPSKAKTDILNQLDTLGINKRKLFPELPQQIEYAVDYVTQHGLDY